MRSCAIQASVCPQEIQGMSPGAVGLLSMAMLKIQQKERTMHVDGLQQKVDLGWMEGVGIGS